MDTLLCMLLFLGALCCPASYHVNEIAQAEQVYHQELTKIKQDHELTEHIIREYTPLLGGIDIFEPNED